METASAYTKTTGNCPARKAMRYYFKEKTNKRFVEKRRTITVTTINEKIRGIKEKHTDLPITPLISLASLQNIHTKRRTESFGKKLLVK